ncbi:MAG: VCBS repeat-containing protein [Agriterribacter sp.]
MAHTKLIAFVLLLAFFVSAQAQKNKSKTMFTRLGDKQTGVYYLNNIEEDDSLNVLRYEYLYNGAGVGVADFNNDSRPDIFFSGNTAPNKLFLNNGAFRFTDVTAEAFVAGNGTWSTGVSIADVNGDGWMDIYVCHSGRYADSMKLCNELFIHQGLKDSIPVFKEMAAVYGLSAPGTQSTQAAFFDYDNDGDLDMFLLNHSNHSYNPLLNTRKVRATPHPYFGNRLFRNDRSADGKISFIDVTQQAGIINHALNFGLSVTVADVNNDGWADIYTTSDYTERDCLYINNRNGTFKESLAASMAHIAKFAMGSDIADYNNDSRPDILTLDMLPEDNHRQKLLKGPDEYDQYHLLLDSGYYHQQMRNMLQLNQGIDEKGNVRFSEIGQLAGISNTDWSWAPLLADFDGDGWKDLFVTNGYLRDFTDLDFLKYTVANAKIAAAKEGHQNFQTVDLVKQMPSNKLYNYIFKNNGDLTFADKTKDWGFEMPGISNAAAYADFDNDGDLDIVICHNNEPASLYRNNARELLENNYIKLNLTGEGTNTKAYGAKVKLTTSDGVVQYQELFPVRGYQSTVSTELYFGVPQSQKITALHITWPDGKESDLADIAANQTLTIHQKDAKRVPTKEKPTQRKFLHDYTAASGIDFQHAENEFIDFKDETLLPYQLSKQGPALAKGDVNNDGLEDVFIGGAIGQSAEIYLQQKDGTFVRSKTQSFAIDRDSEDVNAVFFDVEKDGDLDLYVVSGGNEYNDGSPEYADRLYINDGQGNLAKLLSALPSMLSSKEAIAVGDYNNDGYDDIYVGGKAVPGAFPLPATGYILRNDSKTGFIKFTDVTDNVCEALRKPGMVNSAAWVDIDNDAYPELIIGGDWMPVMLFKNDGGILTDISERAGLKNLSGMWSAIVPKDIDGDGDMDFVMGNCGYNNQFKASAKQPMTLVVNDFDNNGALDPLLCYYIQGKSYPMASRDELLDQIVALKKRFIKYADYADVTVQDIFPKKQLQQSLVLHCEELASGILYNDGNMRFHFVPLPLAAQFSKVYGINSGDYNKDGINDLFLTGNFFPYRVQLGRADAGLGILLKGTGKGQFMAADVQENGYYLGGDIRRSIELKTNSGTLLIIANNNDKVQVLKVD